MKDLEYSKKEIAKQEERIQQYKSDPERDDHDVKKQVARAPATRRRRHLHFFTCLWGCTPRIVHTDHVAQVEVLSEMHAGVPTEVDQLDKYLELLQVVIVSHRRSPRSSGLVGRRAQA